MKKLAFTLAEVLITLGIIGVVAAMTIPTLVTNADKKATATKLKAFYSKINQAVKLSSAYNDEPDGWEYPKSASNYSQHEKFVNTYFAPYMKLSSCRQVSLASMSGCIGCAMSDGSGIVFGAIDGVDIYYITDYQLLVKHIEKRTDFRKDLRHAFAFQINKVTADGSFSGIGKNTAIINQNFVIPYILNWDGNLSTLKNQSRYGCKKTAQYPSYCARWIQENDWKIPNDYPW